MRTVMEEGAGLLKVVIVRGNNLAIRDFTSSDPYVVVKLGKQTAKTKVINSCLNPVWNEELTFYVKEPLGVLKLEVFDRDRFKFDDKMGRAFLDLQPLTSASKLKRALKLTTGETKLRKVAPDSDNCLLADSFITYVNGEIVLDVRIRLCDVESGELAVTVKWIDNPVVVNQVKYLLKWQNMSFLLTLDLLLGGLSHELSSSVPRDSNLHPPSHQTTITSSSTHPSPTYTPPIALDSTAVVAASTATSCPPPPPPPPEEG
ncbi:protein C2-DOMAIN ABA-RELATED 11 [Canna indica]|uniref:Protein C2-DOMAIN ABA-RELATED 11 n=1 Tax=Canna indica TaxID=4628 RepID=A0AAQ3KYQ1_9LILI|nr:protein C2-DOMAIN ABA-RELATED 11 [Canna indica]